MGPNFLDHLYSIGSSYLQLHECMQQLVISPHPLFHVERPPPLLSMLHSPLPIMQKQQKLLSLDPSLSNTMHLDIPSPFFLFFTTSIGAAPFMCSCKRTTRHHALPKFIGPLNSPLLHQFPLFLYMTCRK